MYTAPYRLRLNGRVELVDAFGTAVALRTRRTVLVLAMLAMAGDEGLRRDRLAEAVWPRVESKSARESLRTALSALRSALGANAIRASTECVGLNAQWVVVAKAEGEFMPGFEGDWELEQRLRHRSLAVAEALAAARTAEDDGMLDGALFHVERACNADPLDVEASRRRVQLLKLKGREAEAAVVGGAHRARVVRELGYVPETATLASTKDENPLVRAFEWTLERDPNQACALLAATTTQWLWTDVEVALNAHRRALALAAPSRERQIVGAAESFLEMASGRFERLDVAAARHRAALAEEPTLAGFLCYPLAEGYAARGDFRRAETYRHEAVRTAYARAASGGSGAAIALAENSLGAFEQLMGDRDQSYRRIENAMARIEEDGSPLHLWAIRWSQVAAWIEQGRFDRAAEGIEGCYRAAATHGGERFVAFLIGLEARLYERMGDFVAARESFGRMRAMASAAGVAVALTADEGLMRVHGALGEYEEAIRAWTRAAHRRRQTGIVAAPSERALATPALRNLRERLDPRDIAGIAGSML